MTKLMKVLNFFRLLDADGILSLTNISVIVVVVKLALQEKIDAMTITAFLAAVGGYHFKRLKPSKPLVAHSTKTDQKVAELEAEVTKLKNAIGFKGIR